jgi:hypothetical protein
LRRPKEPNKLFCSVLAGLDPAIHAFGRPKEDVDTRDKPAQDDYAGTHETVKNPTAAGFTDAQAEAPNAAVKNAVDIDLSRDEN